ncbi:MAG: energy transducer TonB [Stigonema ocellatum SAG 48.90 = DSM 106950]|nr:energy transducer TonB [Stigonema ocellatum SAG 48.90 = DSM 106950]
MSFSGVAVEQREKETKALRTFLAFSLVGSLGLHIAVLASGIGNFWAIAPQIKDEPIEVTVIEEAPDPEKTKPKEIVKPRVEQLPPVPKQVVAPIKTQSVEQPKVVVPQPLVPVPPKVVVPQPVVPVPPKPVVPQPVVPVPPKPVVKSQLLRLNKTVVAPRKLELKPQRIVTAPVEKLIPKPQPEVTEPKNTQSKPNPAPTQQSNENLKQTLRGLSGSRATQSGGGGGGGGGGGSRIATGTGTGTVATGTGGGSGTGTGTGLGSGTGSGIGSGTGSGIGSGTGSGIGSGTGSGVGSGTGSGIGSGTGSVRGSGTGIATAPRPRDEVSQFDFVDCIKCDIKYPERAKREGIEGRPGITFDVDNNGNVINIQLTRPSGHTELDEALVSQARKFKLNSAAAGKQNVQLVANFTQPGSQSNREALKRQQDRVEARRQRQAEVEKKKREAATAANETEATSGRRRPRALTPPSPQPVNTTPGQ